MKRLISQMQAVRSTWQPRRVAHSISPRPRHLEPRQELRCPSRSRGRLLRAAAASPLKGERK